MAATLQCSDAQREAAEAAHNTYLQAWSLEVDELERDLNAMEQSFVSQAGAGMVSSDATRRFLRRGLKAVAAMQQVDDALFAAIEDLLSDQQLPAARVWRDSMRGRWHATAPGAWVTIPDPIALLPPASERGPTRLHLIQAMAIPCSLRADQTSRAFDSLMRQVLEACNANEVDIRPAIAEVVTTSNQTWAGIDDAVRRAVMKATRELTSLQQARVRATWLLRDGPTSYDDLAGKDVLEWIRAVEERRLPTADAGACADLIHAALDEIIRIDSLLAERPYPAAERRELQDAMLAAAQQLREPITTHLQANGRNPALTINKSEPERPSAWSQWTGPQLRPLTRGQLEAVSMATGMPMHTLSTHARNAAAAMASDSVIAEANASDLTTQRPRHDLDSAHALVRARRGAMDRVEAIDAAFIDGLGVGPNRARLAKHFIATLRVQPPTRPAHPDAESHWYHSPHRFNILACAVSAGLDLDDPHMADALCRSAELMRRPLHAAAEARTLRLASDAAYVLGEDSVYMPNASATACNEALHDAQMSQRSAAAAAVETIEGVLDETTRPAFRVAVAASLWPHIMEPLERARAVWSTERALTAARSDAAFATLVGHVTEVQERLADLLVSCLIGEDGDDIHARRLLIQAVHDEQIGLVDAWMSDVGDTAPGGP